MDVCCLSDLQWKHLLIAAGLLCWELLHGSPSCSVTQLLSVVPDVVTKHLSAVMAPRFTPRKRNRAPSSAPAPASTDDEEEGGGSSPGLGGTTPVRPAPAAAGAPGPSDTAGIAHAIVEHSRPELLAARAGVIDAMKAALGEVMDQQFAGMVDKRGPLAELVRAICKEEIAAHSEQQPKPEAATAEITKAVCASVVHVIKTTPQARNVHEMGKDELEAAAKKSVRGFKRFREYLPEVMARRIVAIAADAEAPDDVLTIFFPAAARKNRTYSNTEFDKLIMSLLNTIYKKNWLKPKEERPFIMQHKRQLDVEALDVLDVALLALGRSALHEGRSEARGLFFELFAVYFILPGASMELEADDASPPVLGAGADSAYFAVVQKIQASATGIVGGPDAAPVHNVTRKACLYTIASIILQGITLQPYAFEPQVIHPAACNLRTILISTEPVSDDGDASGTVWTREAHKDAEKREGSGVWSLLLPMSDRRPAIIKSVQTLTPTEKQNIRAAEQGGADAGAGTSNAELAPQPSWL